MPKSPRAPPEKAIQRFWCKPKANESTGARNNDGSTPAPGRRDYNTGALSNVGYRGYSWSSAVSGTDGMNLVFAVTWLIPSDANYRVYGFQLRCLSE